MCQSIDSNPHFRKEESPSGHCTKVENKKSTNKTPTTKNKNQQSENQFPIQICHMKCTAHDQRTKRCKLRGQTNKKYKKKQYPSTLGNKKVDRIQMVCGGVSSYR